MWLKNGWIDYVTPQLYWEAGHPLVPFGTLIDWWSRHTYGKHLYIGHGIYRALNKPNSAWKNTNELPNQIKMLRNYPSVQGSVYFSSKSFVSNPNGWNDSLQQNYYNKPALVPSMKWIDSLRPGKPLIEKQTDKGWKITTADPRNTRYFILYCLPEGEFTGMPQEPDFSIIPVTGAKASVVLSEQEFTCSQRLAVTVVNRNNMESELVFVK